MTRHSLALIGAFAVVVAIAGTGLGGQAPQATFRARTDLVSVDVLVKVRNRPVAGLTAADFELSDNGVVQQIDAVSADAVPVDLTLVLDVSGSTARLVEGFKDDVEKIAKLLRPEDQVRVLAFAGTTVQVVAFQRGGARLNLDRLEAGTGGTALDDALVVALAHVPDSPRRHLVAVFTDGGENSSLIERRALVAAAARAPGLLHLVLPRPMSAPSRAFAAFSLASLMGPVPPGQDSLQEVADATGGSVVISDKSAKILDGFRIVFEMFRSGYVLHYTPRGVRLTGWHDLTVKMKAPGTFDIRARKGYSGG